MIKTTLGQYYEEVRDIKKKLTHFIDQISKGEISYIKDISLKLRLFYCDKSGEKSLLYTLEDHFKFKAFVYIRHSIKEAIITGELPKSLLDSLSINQTNNVITWFFPGGKLMDVFDALNRKEDLLIDGNNYSYLEIFETMADKMGGAHLDSEISEIKLLPHSKNFLINDLSAAQLAIYDTARATIQLIEYIENYVNKHKVNDHIVKN